ncbi:MAG TPA: hypothetical protein VN203_06680, partial [Candidatus Acidoferrum sp.]|nr:hypothetical protein [Candidatus Acidoferrum sp.]
MAPDLWDQFAQASNLKDFCRAWLMLQCGMLKGIRSALVLLGPPDRGPFTPAAIWPTAEFNVQHLVGSAERALKERRGFLVQSADLNPENAVENYHLAYPLEISGKVHGVVLLEVLPTSAEAMQGIMRRLHWGAGWLEAILRRTEAQRAKDASEGMRLILDLLVSVVEQERFQPAAMALVTQLAIRLECDRVSLGFEEGKKLRVKALSHSAEVGQHMNLVRAIASAMDEAIDQQSPIVFPSPQGTTPLVMRSHTELARQQGTGAICTVPL